MESTFVRIPQTDGHQTKLYQYLTSSETVLGNVLILHGMAEHHERYHGFIHALNKEGFDVYAYDHRGHGKDKKLTELGFFAKKGGATLVINDAVQLCHYIKEHGRSKKFAVLGHSMGSLILRNLIQVYDEMDCALVCSSTMPPVAVSNAGLFITNLFCLFQGPKKVSKTIDNILFGGKAYKALCTRTSYDWLTRNNTLVGQYINDPYCGFTCTTSFYRDLVQLTKWAAQKSKISRTRKDLPVGFFAGEKDPVGGYGAEIKKLHKLFLSLGFTDASITLYPEARHELLNELNVNEVTADLVAFLHKYLG